MIEYKKGDRVIVTKQYCNAEKGMIGTVVGNAYGNAYGIIFDKYFPGGHNLSGTINGIFLNGRCDRGFGHFIFQSNLKLLIKIKKSSYYKCMACFKEFKGKEIINNECPYCKSNTIIKIENV